MTISLREGAADFGVLVLLSQLPNPRDHLICVPARGTTDLNGWRKFTGYDLPVNCGTRKAYDFANLLDIQKLCWQSKISVHRPTAPLLTAPVILIKGLGALKRPEQIGYFPDPKTL